MLKPKYFVHTINKDTHIIEEKIMGNQLCYLLSGEERALLIDTGIGTEEFRDTVRSLTSLPIVVVNTHAHLDHFGGNHFFHELWMHEDDIDVFKLHADPAYLTVLLHEALPLALRIILGRTVRRILQVDASGNYQYFQDGHVFRLGGRDVEVIHTPGHSPGSTCFLDRGERILYSGDTVCEWGILLHLDGSCSPETYFKSMRRLKSLSTDFDMIYPGHHGFPIDKGYIDEYIACAEHIIDGTAKMGVDHGRRCGREGRILITVPAESQKR